MHHLLDLLVKVPFSEGVPHLCFEMAPRVCITNFLSIWWHLLPSVCISKHFWGVSPSILSNNRASMATVLLSISTNIFYGVWCNVVKVVIKIVIKISFLLTHLILIKNIIVQHYVSSYAYWQSFICFNCVVSENILLAKFSLAPLVVGYTKPST